MTLSVTRLANFVGRDWGKAVVFVGATLYTCGGWCNVVLYTATRKGIVSWDWFGWIKWAKKRWRKKGTGKGTEGKEAGAASGAQNGLGIKKEEGMGVRRELDDLNWQSEELDIVRGGPDLA